MAGRYRYDPTDTRAANMFGAAQMQEIVGGIITGLKAVLTFIGVLTLAIGGVGIMNIMFVNVQERTREIGVRKALGATRTNILLQFMIEALTLCILGGAIGIVVGVGTTIVLARVMQWNTLISPMSVLVAFGFSALVGLFFGIWPARRAARLDPIVALRYE